MLPTSVGLTHNPVVSIAAVWLVRIDTSCIGHIYKTRGYGLGEQLGPSEHTGPATDFFL